MTDSTAIAIVTTIGTEAEAQKLAKELVAAKLVACAQISLIESIYHWDGEVQQDKEFQVRFKTIATNYKAVETAILERHSYDLPQIYAIALPEIYEPYAEWVAENSVE